MKREVIYFWAEWCHSCCKFKPTFRSVSKELSSLAKFTEVDVETQFGVDLSVKYSIRNVPTILVVEDGKVIKKLFGTIPKSKMVEELKSVL